LGAIVLAGSLASGKTSLARQLCARCRGTYASFGRVVILEARNRGIPTTRSALQDLGNTLEAELGPVALVDRAVAMADLARPGHVVFDSVRHESVWHAVQTRYDSSSLVYLIVEERLAVARLVARDGIDEESAYQAVRHPMEVNARRLQEFADITLSGGDVDEWVDQVLAAIPDWECQS